MDRRHFVKTLALASAGVLAHGCAPMRGWAGDKTVIVIGAGMAGLSAAYDLAEAGVKVVVLEARERLGGRIWTHRGLGVPIDLGASWIHGKEGNPLLEIARDEGITCRDTDYDDFRLWNGSTRLPDEQLERLEQSWEELLAEVEELANQGGADRSFQAAVDAVLAGEQLDPMEKRYLAWRLETLTVATAARPEDLSLLGDTMDRYGGGDCLMPQGYDQFVTLGAEGLDIRLGHVVRSIVARDKSVEVHVEGLTAPNLCAACHDQGGRSGAGAAPVHPVSAPTFTADAAVVTLPLGVLASAVRRGSVRFEPGLPASKVEAIGSLGIGDLNKVALRFEKSFWPRDHQFFGDIDGVSGRFPVYQDYESITGAPVIVAFSGGRTIRPRETRSDQEITDEVMGNLRRLFGRSLPSRRTSRSAGGTRIPLPSGAIRTSRLGVRTGPTTSSPSRWADCSSPVRRRFGGIRRPSTGPTCPGSGLRAKSWPCWRRGCGPPSPARGVAQPRADTFLLFEESGVLRGDGGPSIPA